MKNYYKPNFKEVKLTKLESAFPKPSTPYTPISLLKI